MTDLDKNCVSLKFQTDVCISYQIDTTVCSLTGACNTKTVCLLGIYRILTVYLFINEEFGSKIMSKIMYLLCFIVLVFYCDILCIFLLL